MRPGRLVAALTALAAARAAPLEKRGEPCVMYEVRPGDYCYAIATANGVGYGEFLQQNPGLDCNNLHVGDSVCLHRVYGCRAYWVRAGDLCSGIAQRFGISVRELISRNRGSPEWMGCMHLYDGQRLCV
ncbi:hypothetical protein H4R18_001516 [Coemansia javaensis]|uniref:LysM domain-containing protein n=1 Tax=Coemansia javaensis TaxID=2761396 RepID=A0A9W8HES3_9FUNG|nr:hypothetical protein H4R18_001516 [Coemansia javaensis]